MVYRRHILSFGLMLAGTALLPARPRAQGAEKAKNFVQVTADRMTAIVNGAQAAAEKRRALTQILETSVDIDGIARFCLGRFWKNATQDQQKRYTIAFHDVLVTNITVRLGEYRGVKLTVQKERAQDDDAIVTTLMERPNNPPTIVEWVIGQPASAPKIVDVLAEGTSLRLTQRQDYASYLQQHAGDVEQLIEAMKNQSAKGG